MIFIYLNKIIKRKFTFSILVGYVCMLSWYWPLMSRVGRVVPTAQCGQCLDNQICPHYDNKPVTKPHSSWPSPPALSSTTPVTLGQDDLRVRTQLMFVMMLRGEDTGYLLQTITMTSWCLHGSCVIVTGVHGDSGPSISTGGMPGSGPPATSLSTMGQWRSSATRTWSISCHWSTVIIFHILPVSTFLLVVF